MDTCSQMPGVLAAAATSMANLRTVQLTLVLPAAEDAAEPSTQEGRDTMLAGLLSPMFELQQLRHLALNTDVLGPSTAAALGGLKQLSCLHLRHQNHGEDTPGPCWDLDYRPPTVDLNHLSSLWNSHSTSVIPIPAHALAALTALVHLVTSYDLPLASAAGWEALGCLQVLTHLAGVVVQEGPPAGWQHTGVVKLDVEMQVADSVAAVRVLAALPALQQADLLVQELLPGPDLDGAVAGLGGSGDNTCTNGSSSTTTITSSSNSSSTRDGVTCTVGSSSSSSSSSSSNTVLNCSPHLKALSIKCFGGIPAMYAAPLIAAAGDSLMELTLNGDMEPGDTSAPLPDLSACITLTRLDLGRSEEAEEGDLLALLQPLAPSLRVLCLSKWRKVSPAAAMVLQQVLQRLEKVAFECCRELDEDDSSGVSEETQLQSLRQQLRPGLTLDMASW
jgi:hypothetical protein